MYKSTHTRCLFGTFLFFLSSGSGSRQALLFVFGQQQDRTERRVVRWAVVPWVQVARDHRHILAANSVPVFAEFVGTLAV